MKKMSLSIGVNLRVTGHCHQGGRRYMEDAFAVAYQQTNDERDLEYAFFGIFDGHGGREAAVFAKEHLMKFIVNQKNFWSDNDDNVLKSIRDGFVATHMAMWKQVATWPQTVSGLPSTSGTTASVIFIRRGKMYVGHVGDSAIVLGFKDPSDKRYGARPLTSDHKPESPAERKRIEDVGGSVMSKCGVQRVVWNRPRIGHKGPIRRSTRIDQIPFLAVARSLGDLWSYDYFRGQFIVSPEPDVHVVTLDPKRDRCIVLATDGVWNMISYKEAVRVVEAAEQENERQFMCDETRQIGCKPLVNPSKLLVDRALDLWTSRKKRADNTSVVTVMLDPPGPPKSEVLLRKRMMQKLRPRDIDVDVCDRRDSPRVLVTHAPDYVPVESSPKLVASSEHSPPPCSPCGGGGGPGPPAPAPPPPPPWPPAPYFQDCRPPLPPKMRSLFGGAPPLPPPPLPSFDYPPEAESLAQRLRRAPTPPVPPEECPSHHHHPRSFGGGGRGGPTFARQPQLQRTSQLGSHRAADDSLLRPARTSGYEPHNHVVSSSSTGYVPDRFGDDSDALVVVDDSADFLLFDDPADDLEWGDDDAVGDVEEEPEPTTTTYGLKRKTPPAGNRSSSSSCDVVAKQSRTCRGGHAQSSALPRSCALATDLGTRARMRLRKAQA